MTLLMQGMCQIIEPRAEEIRRARLVGDARPGADSGLPGMGAGQRTSIALLVEDAIMLTPGATGGSPAARALFGCRDEETHLARA